MDRVQQWSIGDKAESRSFVSATLSVHTTLLITTHLPDVWMTDPLYEFAA